MPVQFSSTGALTKVNGVKVLVYGEAGSGKTLLCATAPTPLIISAESGLLSLRPENLARHEQQVQRALPRDIPVITITTYLELFEVYNWCRASTEARHFRTLCLDSVSEIAERVLAHAKSTVKDPRQAYGQLIDNTVSLIRGFRDLPGFHVYFSAKSERMKDEGTGQTYYGPSMPGKALGPALPYFFDEVFHLGIGKAGDGSKYRYLRTQPDLQYSAKDRSGSLAEIERPDLGYIFSKITGA